MKKIYAFSLFLTAGFLFPMQTQAQVLFGKVTDAAGKPLPDVLVFWTNTVYGAATNKDGDFALPAEKIDTAQKPLSLTAVFGEARDTFFVDAFDVFWELAMSANVTFSEVVVTDQSGASISVLQPVKTEIINRNELRKAACCDLAGCFETQSTVQPTTTNVLTNAKELRILGLSGVYNQVLVDGLPTVQGLTYTYGTGTIPGSMLENIWVVKGANSVLQGFESMVGQITIFPREGGTAEPLTADVLVNSFGEKHFNAGLAVKNKKWTNYLALHTSLPGGKWDRDDDGFLDLPLLRRFSLYNKWRFGKENEKGFSTFVGLRFVNEQRIGGQENFDPETDGGSTRAYGQTVYFNQPEIFTKTGWRFDENNKITLLASFVQQKQDSWFGLTRYDAFQQYAYANLQYELFWGKEKAHELKFGASCRNFTLDENISFAAADTLGRGFAGDYLKKERITGAFVENILHLQNDCWVVITGIRADHHNEFGTEITPRLMLRFNPGEKLDLRASAGSGWRTVNLFPENLILLTSNRDLVFAEKINPEHSWNAGVNATRRFSLGKWAFTATGDFYRTWFQNQFFPDYDADPDRAILVNFTEKSISNGLQLEFLANWQQRIELRIAYNFLDVFRVENGLKTSLPFNPKHKVLAVATYRSANRHWQFDLNAHWYGKQRLPGTGMNPDGLQRPDYSDAYTVASGQIRWTKLKNWDFFAGCENIFDFRQRQPILGWQQPFARGFDPAFAWGPTRGREFYMGFNFKLE